MFARILKSSLIPLMAPARLSTLHKTLPKAYKISLIQAFPRYQFSSIPEYQKQAQTIMKDFIQKEAITGNDVLQALGQLENAALGVTNSDVNFKTFMIRLNDAIRGKLTAEQLEAIALKAHSLNIKEPIFWFSLDNTIKSSDSNVGLNSLLVLFSTFLRVKSYPQFSRYLSVMQAELLEGLKNSLPELDFRSLIHASYIFASLETPFPELTKRFKTELRASLKNPNSVDISINELATTAALLPVLLKDNDTDKQELITSLGKFLSGQDLSQYCNKSAEGEERLNWQSLAFLFRTYSLPKYQNQELLTKLSELVSVKAETSNIDFDSASLLLSVLCNQDKAANTKVIEKVLDMVHTQLANEGAAMFNEFDGRNVAAFLRAIIVLGQKGVNKELIGELIEYFQGLIISNKISTKIEEEEFSLLKKLFEDAKSVGNVDARIFDHIQKRVEYIAAQKKRESAENQNQM